MPLTFQQLIKPLQSVFRLENVPMAEKLATWTLPLLVIPVLSASAAPQDEKVRSFSRDFARYSGGVGVFFGGEWLGKQLIKTVSKAKPGKALEFGAFLFGLTLNMIYTGYFSEKLADWASNTWKKLSPDRPININPPNQNSALQTTLIEPRILIDTHSKLKTASLPGSLLSPQTKTLSPLKSSFQPRKFQSQEAGLFEPRKPAAKSKAPGSPNRYTTQLPGALPLGPRPFPR